MKRTTFVPLIVIMVVISLLGINRPCRADDVSLGRQAEQAGKLRQALTHYVEALKADEANQQLREKIIRLAQKIQPPPAIPEEARRHLARGRAAVKAAQNTEGYLKAAKEFEKSLRAAPWHADVFYNLGVVRDKAGQYDDAIWALKMYLLARPEAEDASQVQDLIYEIEYRQENAASLTKTKQVEEKKASLDSLSGSWSARVWGGSDIIYRSRQLRVQSPRPSRNGKWRTFHTDSPVHVEIKGNSIRINMTSNGGRGRSQYIGTIDGNHITGTLVNYDDLQLFCSKTRDYNFEGEIWPKDQVIMVITEDCHIQMPSDKRCYYQAKGCFLASYLFSK